MLVPSTHAILTRELRCLKGALAPEGPLRVDQTYQSLLVAITTSRSYAPLKVFWSIGVELYCHTV
jgi:hypothetical protein